MLSLQMSMLVLFGTILGSFLNVCIYRLPRKESIVWPNSHCPYCKYPIPIWKNIPLLSYILLGGKCSNCKTKISVTYPLVELVTALLLILVWQQFGWTTLFWQHTFLILLLITISLIDLNHKLILNVLTFPGIAMGLALALIFNTISPLQAILGLFMGGGFLWLVGYAGKILFKQDSMGAGDVKLAAMIGSFIGPTVVVALFFAFFLALPVIAIGLISGRLKMGHTIPFGPFISLGTVLIICFGTKLYHVYFNLIDRIIY
ncbi:MAG: prepilin peptidase [bacterium]